MIGARLVNGQRDGRIAAEDRGLQYGDGLFETMAVVDGAIRLFDLHLERLALGCDRLGLPLPPRALLEDECGRVTQGLQFGSVKLVLTRGTGPRGYRPPREPAVTRIVASQAIDRTGAAKGTPGLVLRVCETRLGLNPALAGLKHLNRLEQVLASREWDDPAVAEGLMLSSDGRLICGTQNNLFLVRAGRLMTPDLRDCGVAGVMRRAVIETAKRAGMGVDVGDLALDDLAMADELFLTNALRGVRPVAEVLGHGRWGSSGVAAALAGMLGLTPG